MHSSEKVSLAEALRENMLRIIFEKKNDFTVYLLICDSLGLV